MNIVSALGPVANWKCFVLFKLLPKAGTWKSDKVPVDPLTGHNSDAQDPGTWMDAHEAALWATQFGAGYGVGVVIYEGSGLFCIDLDDAVLPDGQWSPTAQAVCARFPGAAMELSASGRGLHILGRYAGVLEPHSSKCAPLKMEAYTKARFIGLTGTYWTGDMLSDHTRALTNLLLEYFPPRAASEGAAEWTTEPVKKWDGPQDDTELVNRALKSHGAGSVFGSKASFKDLWVADPDRLARAYPSSTGDVWDRSSADLALANHLAFWTGNNCARMERLLNYSALRRDKWERRDYFEDTVLRACATQREWYNGGQGHASPAQEVAGSSPKIEPDGSKPAIPSDIPQPLATAPGTISLGTPGAGVVAPTPSAVPPTVVTTPSPGTIAIPTSMYVEVSAAELERPQLTGLNIPQKVKLKAGDCPAPGELATSDDQQLIFAGCTYVEDIDMVLMPDGTLLDSKRFDNRFPGVTWVVTNDGTKPTRSAWDAFVQSECYSFPKVRGLYFAPTVATGEVVWKDGLQYINSYVPIELLDNQGDYSPFWNHLKKLLPNGRDAEILLYYMAAMVQNPGVKFSWWPFIQGVPGNGKSFICEALEQCVGAKFTHAADASKLGGRFNSAFYGKLFARIDEVKIDHQRGNVWEAVKLLITQTRLEVEAKGVDSVTREMPFNGVMLSNYKNGIRKTAEDRRICPLFCAQQTVADLFAQGMVDDPLGETSKYFDELWAWAENGGWAVIRWMLLNTTIPDKLNPAKSCRRAPTSSSTMEAITEGWGAAEQEVVEAIQSEHEGFRGGWVSSVALDMLLARIGKGNVVPRNTRVQLLTAMGYVTHPGLSGGRIPTRLTDGSMPVLFVKPDHATATLTSALEIANAYTTAQKVTR